MKLTTLLLTTGLSLPLNLEYATDKESQQIDQDIAFSVDHQDMTEKSWQNFKK